MNQTYVPVVARLGLTSEQRADAINQELYNLQLPKHLHPPGQVTSALLPTAVHPSTGEVALVADNLLTIEVHPQRDLHALIALFPQLSKEEESKLVYHLATNQIVLFSDLIPSDVTALSHAEAEAAGWFG